MMAAAEAERDLMYFTFGDADLVKDVLHIHKLITDTHATVGKRLTHTHHTLTNARTYTHTLTHTHTHTHACMHTLSHTLTLTQTHTHTHSYTQTHSYTHSFIHSNSHTHTHTLSSGITCCLCSVFMSLVSCRICVQGCCCSITRACVRKLQEANLRKHFTAPV